ncbi:MAG: hypothetical protein M2R45_05221 [Verrucomicrobia subdivision 3 bacterium]|nr:hypothetical protein [Limisphaerales bacterium]MCS1417455.1 hypothetical protein [Limisphaerales bacterium]
MPKAEERNFSRMITCWLTRQKIAKCLDDGTSVGASIQAHLHQCSACETYQQQQVALVGQLTREAQQGSLAPSLFLQGKIVAAVRRAAEPGPEIAPSGRLAWPGGFALTVVAAALIVAGIIWKQPNPQPQTSILLTEVIRLSGDKVLKETTGQNFEAWSVTINQPLESEIQFVMNDARSAIDSLAASFLPEQFLTSNTALPQ